MNSPSKLRFIKFLIALSVFTLMSTLLVSKYGVTTGLYIALLIWSLYILSIPAAHGMIIFGTPIHLFRHKPFFTQPFVWVGAFILNAITVIFSPTIYVLTIPTHLLLCMIETPSCWLVFIFSALGTMYPVLIGNEKFYANKYLHTLIYHIIKLVALLAFVYYAHPELVIILNTLS